MKVGIVVPQFRHDARTAFTLVDEAERSGIDGVFCFDHLWPMGRTSGPSLSCLPLVAALAARTDRLHVGTLVARSGLVSPPTFVRALRTVHEIAGSRFIAGIGVGDRASHAENAAYGVTFPALDERIATALESVRALRHDGVTVWLGGRSGAIRSAAESSGVVVNQWGVEVDCLSPHDTWGGPLRDVAQLRQLWSRAVPWAVFLVAGTGDDPRGAVRRLADLRAEASRHAG